MDINVQCLNTKNYEINHNQIQDSSIHILNTLNDDCIQEILQRLTNVRDFLNASEVCTQFQSNAIQCFPLPFRTICIRDGEIFSDAIPVERLRSFLHIFGHLIKSIRWNTTDRNADNHVLNAIADFCGKSLRELAICDHTIEITTQFKELEKLEIETSLISSFKIQCKLKVLKLKLVKILHFDSFEQTMHQLQVVEFVNVNGFTNEMLVKFLSCNPQLKSFKLEGCKRISTSVLRNIGKSVPNLVNLHLMFFGPFFENADMLHIVELRKLSSLGFNCPKFPAKSLIEMLAENKVPLEDLIISGYVNDLAESILKLKLLKKLNVGNVSEEVFMTFAKDLQCLEEIRIECKDISAWGIKEALKKGKHMKMLTIIIGCPIVIDLNTYNSILILAKERVRVLLMIRTEKCENNKNNFSLNRDWVNVCYF